MLRAWSPAAFTTIALLVLAGCTGPTETGDDEPHKDPAWLGAPPICVPSRPAIPHHAGGHAINASEISAPIPCLSKTGVNSREPTIGISSKGTVFHYPAMTGHNAEPMGVAISHDQGVTWELVLPDIAGQPTHIVSTDPYFFLDPTTDRIFADDLNVPNCSIFSWSDDEGETWDNSYSGCLETDHQSIFTGPPVTSMTVGYPNIVYRCAINAVALAGSSTMTTCQRSLDGGRTWLPPTPPAYETRTEELPGICDGAAGHGTTDPDGRVYLPKGWCGEPWLAISDDEGMSWTRTRVADGGIHGHDAGVGVDPGGTIFYFWVASEDRLPYLAYSDDGGATWSEARMVGAPGVNEASQPEMIVGGTGKLAFVYMGTTTGPGPPFDGDYSGTTWNAYVGMTVDATSDDPVFWTASINDPEEDVFVVGTCGAIRCQGVQDFLDIRVAPDGTPWAALVDDCLGPGADCDSPDEPLDTHREGAVGRLYGGPSLWDEDDPNGHYP